MTRFHLTHIGLLYAACPFRKEYLTGTADLDYLRSIPAPLYDVLSDRKRHKQYSDHSLW